jgi:hypothetical protein
MLTYFILINYVIIIIYVHTTLTRYVKSLWSKEWPTVTLIILIKNC